MPARRIIGHVEPPELGDSLAGVLRSIEQGHAGQDINIHTTADGHLIPLHWTWGHGWVYPDGKPVTKARPITSMTLAEAKTLRNTRTPKARIEALTDLLDAAHAASPDFIGCPEAKPDPRLEVASTYAPLVGRQVIVMSIQRLGTGARGDAWEAASMRRLKAARDAGLPTMLLWRRHIPADSPWWSIVHAVKGAPKTQALPPSVIRVPSAVEPVKALPILRSVIAAANPQPKESDVLTSQNGWPALAADHKALHTWIIPARTGTIRLRLRNGSAGFILAHFALWFAETIEPLAGKVADDWGYASRPIRGQTSGLSNHAAGCAMDLNATKHVLGKRGTFGRTKAARIVARLALYEGCIRWGGTYQRRADEMHFEVVQSLPVCERVARKLMRTWRGERLLLANPSQKEVILS